jgi:signal transduction histidine kinase
MAPLLTTRRLRFRSSVLLKSIAAVVSALVASTVVTSMVSSRLTRSALDEHSRRLGQSQMSILQEAYRGRDTGLRINLSNLNQILAAQNLFAPERRTDLIGELGRAKANLQLDTLYVLDTQGNPLAHVGEELADPENVPRIMATSPGSRLLNASDRTFIQAIGVQLPGQPLVVGGYSFDDQFAYMLRRQIGSLEDVVLVARGLVVGSTLPVPPKRPPTPADQAELPTAPTRVARADFTGLVAYVTLGRTTDPERGAIGLVLNDPAASLQGSLDRARLAATLILVLVALGLAILLYRYLIRPLVGLSGTARRIAAGDLDASFETTGEDEIAMLATSLERMRVELRTKIDLIASQAADLQRQASDLQESSQRIVAAEDNERHRLARDLHDGIQQELVVLRMRVGMAAEAALRVDDPPQGAADRRQQPREVVEEFEQLGAELDATIERLREVTRNLYPSILLDRGLAVATRSYIRRLPMAVRLSSPSEPFPRLNPAIESGAYFLLCEALTNAFKHAGSGDIAISLCAEDDWLTVCVTDDGRGISPDQVRGRGGLLHMHDRVRSFGGELEISSAPGKGTVIRARFPRRLHDDAQTTLPDPVVVAEPPDRGAATVSRPPSPERTGLPRPAG